FIRRRRTSASALCTHHSSLKIGGSNFVLQNFDRECSVTLDPSSGVRGRCFFHNPGLYPGANRIHSPYGDCAVNPHSKEAYFCFCTHHSSLFTQDPRSNFEPQVAILRAESHWTPFQGSTTHDPSFTPGITRG